MVTVAAAPSLLAAVQPHGLPVGDHHQERGRPRGARHQGPDHVTEGVGDPATAPHQPGDQAATGGCGQ